MLKCIHGMCQIRYNYWDYSWYISLKYQLNNELTCTIHVVENCLEFKLWNERTVDSWKLYRYSSNWRKVQLKRKGPEIAAVLIDWAVGGRGVHGPNRVRLFNSRLFWATRTLISFSRTRFLPSELSKANLKSDEQTDKNRCFHLSTCVRWHLRSWDDATEWNDIGSKISKANHCDNDATLELYLKKKKRNSEAFNCDWPLCTSEIRLHAIATGNRLRVPTRKNQMYF